MKIMRSFRVDESLWRRAQLKAIEEDKTVTDVLLASLREYVKEPNV